MMLKICRQYHHSLLVLSPYPSVSCSCWFIGLGCRPREEEQELVHRDPESALEQRLPDCCRTCVVEGYPKNRHLCGLCIPRNVTDEKSSDLQQPPSGLYCKNASMLYQEDMAEQAEAAIAVKEQLFAKCPCADSLQLSTRVMIFCH